MQHNNVTILDSVVKFKKNACGVWCTLRRKLAQIDSKYIYNKHRLKHSYALLSFITYPNLNHRTTKIIGLDFLIFINILLILINILVHFNDEFDLLI